MIQPDLVGRPRNDYPEDFENAWGKYPKRAGGNPKIKAYKAWQKRLKAGYTAKEMTAGVERYAEMCRATGKINTEFVMQAATFFGPDENFLEDYPLPTGRAQPPAWAKLPFDDNKLWDHAKEHGLPGPGSMTYPQYRRYLQACIEKRLEKLDG